MSEFTSKDTVKEGPVFRLGNGSSLAALLTGTKEYRNNVLRLRNDECADFPAEKSLAWYTASKNKLVHYYDLCARDYATNQIVGDEKHPFKLRVVPCENMETPTADARAQIAEQCVISFTTEAEMKEWLTAFATVGLPAGSTMAHDPNETTIPGSDERTTLSDDARQEILDKFWTRLGGSDDVEGDDGEAYFTSLANADGELDEEAFSTFLSTYLTSKISKMNDMDTGEMGLPSGAASVIKKKFSQRLLKSFPVLTRCVFNMFDYDGGGTISKAEVENAIIMIATLDTRKGKFATFYEITDTIFRVLDKDGNGEIDADEVSSIFGTIVTNVIKFLSSFMEDLEPYIVQGPIVGSVAMFFEMLTEMQGGGEDIKLKDLAASFVQVIFSDVGGDKKSKLFFNKVKKFLGKGIKPLLKIRAMLNAMIEANVDADGAVPKDVLVDIWVEQVEAMLEGMIGEGGEFFKMMVMEFLAETEAISEETQNEVFPQIDTFLESLKTAIDQLLQNGTVKLFISAFFEMLDVNNDGKFTKDEINGFLDAIIETAKVCTGFATQEVDDEFEVVQTEYGEDSYLVVIEKLFMAVASLADANNDGSLDLDECIKLARKVVKLIMSLVNLWLSSLTEVCVNSIKPAFMFLMGLKADIVGGARSVLSREDLDALFLLEISYLQKEWL